MWTQGLVIFLAGQQMSTPLILPPCLCLGAIDKQPGNGTLSIN